jgi:hypothetical protein
MDFSKAFDKVSHSLLQHKLDHYGIRGKTCEWIKTFLSDRRPSVVIEGESSDKKAFEKSIIIVGCPVLKKTLSYRVWVNGITHG